LVLTMTRKLKCAAGMCQKFKMSPSPCQFKLKQRIDFRTYHLSKICSATSWADSVQDEFQNQENTDMVQRNGQVRWDEDGNKVTLNKQSTRAITLAI
jgi:hypothetical protein